jgi:hypothetical protein
MTSLRSNRNTPPVPPQGPFFANNLTVAMMLLSPSKLRPPTRPVRHSKDDDDAMCIPSSVPQVMSNGWLDGERSVPVTSLV